MTVLSPVDVMVVVVVETIWCHYDGVRVDIVCVIVTVMVGVLLLLFRGGCGGCGRAEEDRSGTRKPPSQWKVSDLDIVLSDPTGVSPQSGDSNNSESLKGARETVIRLAAPASSLTVM